MITLAASCAQPAGSEDGAPAAATPRNLLLISIDTLRADHLGSYGYARPTSPRLDAYAARGTVFENCTSSSSWTVPAHLTMFTGMEPAAHRCVYYGSTGRLNENYETMAKIFTRRGFRTAGFTGGGYASPRHGMAIGFEEYESHGSRFEDNWEAMWEWLNADTETPFFLFLQGFNTHRPYAPPGAYKTLFADGYNGTFRVTSVKPNMPEPSAEDMAYIISQYDGEIRYVDDLLGEFLDELERRGVLRETLVIITSDHGEEFFDHGNWDHIRTLYDELIRAPWITFGPGIASQRLPHHVGTIDLLPTVLDLFGIGSDVLFQGVSRAALLRGEPVEQTDGYVFSFTGKGGKPKHLCSVRNDRWKLVVNKRAGRNNPKCKRCREGLAHAPKYELYDLQRDPAEQNNLAEQHADIVASLTQRLEERVARSYELRKASERPEPATAEHLERLRSLGYLD